ncbi:MAG TPA: cache domain-containing protein [Geminicoccaceae bacterium]|nr:cache domain-containing protein [Geminicoccaceae bacterium]
MKRIGFAVAVAGVMAVLGSSWASDPGTEEEARAMLERAIVALKEDEAAALASFTAGAPDFKDRDLYVFCVAPTGVVTANGGHPDHIGLDTHSEIDSQGKNIGEAILAAAEPGEINVATYMYPPAGQVEPALKSALISQVDDQICGVGYYGQ